MKIFIFSIILNFFASLSFAQTEQIKLGLDIINMVRDNYGQPELKFSNSLSEYALKKATQYVYGDHDEITVSKDDVGVLFTSTKGEGSKVESEMKNTVAKSVLALIDIDCDDGEAKYDLFNQIVDDVTKEIGIASFYDNDLFYTVFVFDNHVYNQETDSEEN